MTNQNTIAIIWDFDKTLIPGYMQEPIFKKYGVDATAFWDEVNSLPEKYRARGVHVSRDTIYLNHMLTCAQQGIFSGLNNAMLRELGGQIEFYPGVIQLFSDLKACVHGKPKYQEMGIHLEHYIISTGLSEMIRGSAISGLVDGIWGCEFIEAPFPSMLKAEGPEESPAVISQIGYMIDNTTKTRAAFEINKGVNKFPEIDVNSSIAKEKRRVPFEYMIYIADGPSDVPVFSVIRQNGGKTFAVYPKGDGRLFRQVNRLREDGRVNMYAEADYTKDSTAYMWLMEQTTDVADSIYQKIRESVSRSASPPPLHINEIERMER